MRKFIFTKGKKNMNDYSKLSINEINNLLNNLSLMKDSFILMGTDVEKQRELLMNAKNTKILETLNYDNGF